MKIINLILEILTAPFNLLIRSNAIPNPNKSVKPVFVLLVTLLIVAILIFITYYEVFIHA